MFSLKKLYRKNPEKYKGIYSRKFAFLHSISYFYFSRLKNSQKNFKNFVEETLTTFPKAVGIIDAPNLDERVNSYYPCKAVVGWETSCAHMCVWIFYCIIEYSYRISGHFLSPDSRTLKFSELVKCVINSNLKQSSGEDLYFV